MAAQDDLLAPLAPAAPDAMLRPGTIEGPEGWEDELEALVARLRVWCGSLHGWRDVGEIRGTGGLLWHQGRLSVGMSFDLGPAVLSRRERPVAKGLDSIETLSGAADQAEQSQS